METRNIRKIIIGTVLILGGHRAYAQNNLVNIRISNYKTKYSYTDLIKLIITNNSKSIVWYRVTQEVLVDKVWTEAVPDIKHPFQIVPVSRLLKPSKSIEVNLRLKDITYRPVKNNHFKGLSPPCRFSAIVQDYNGKKQKKFSTFIFFAIINNP